MYKNRPKTYLDTLVFNRANYRKTLCLCGVQAVCPIITQASTRLTIPVAFILSNLLIYLFFVQFLLQCPTSACVYGAPWHLSTAATRSGRCIRHRRRSHRSPVAFIYLSPFTILYGTTIPPLSLRGSNATVAISSEQLILEIATPVCATLRNDSGSRQPPTIILQITLLVSVKGRRLYRKIYFLQ